MSTSTTPNGTLAESAGMSTASDAQITVLDFTARVGQEYWIANTGSVMGFYKTSEQREDEWQPFLPGNAYPFTSITKGNVKVYVKRIPAGTNVTGIQGGAMA